MSYYIFISLKKVCHAMEVSPFVHPSVHPLTCCIVTTCCINSLTPAIFEWYFRYLNFQIISVIDGWGISFELAIRWMSLNLTDEKSTLVQVMAWCHQATSHYLSQWWPRALLPYGDTRPQWVNSSLFGQNGHSFANNICRCIFVNEKFCIWNNISPKFLSKGLIDNNSALD